MDEVYSGDEVMPMYDEIANPNAIVEKPSHKVCLAMVKLKLAELERAIEQLDIREPMPVDGKNTIKKALMGKE